MKFNVLAPSVGESITEVSILKWVKKNGQTVKNGEIVLEIESDKATVEVVAEGDGVLQTLKNEGDRIPVGTLLGTIDSDGKATVASSAPAVSAPAPTVSMSTAGGAGGISAGGAATHLSPAVKKIVTEKNIDPSTVTGTGKGGRLTKGDVLQATPGVGSMVASTGTGAVAAGLPKPVAQPGTSTMIQVPSDRPGQRRVPMSLLRAKIAERLVQAQHTAAILTTFNEVDMTEVMAIRNEHKDNFKAKHGSPLSFMSFFTLASVEALKAIPEVNAYVDGKDIIYNDFYDVGIAVGTERGLVVPVLRDAGSKSLLEIEKGIGEMALKARNGKLSIADMSGGTFTISNGGTYGSLMSTPILNPPQSGILGMHKIQERPVVMNGQVVARPMMYLALSYDHRIIDGKGAVTFLVQMKEFLENREKLNLVMKY